MLSATTWATPWTPHHSAPQPLSFSTCCGIWKVSLPLGFSQKLLKLRLIRAHQALWGTRVHEVTQMRKSTARSWKPGCLSTAVSTCLSSMGQSGTPPMRAHHSALVRGKEEARLMRGYRNRAGHLTRGQWRPAGRRLGASDGVHTLIWMAAACWAHSAPSLELDATHFR